MPRSLNRLAGVTVVLWVLMAGMLPTPAQADATIVVNTAADPDSATVMNEDGWCSLREAINNANYASQPYQPHLDCDPGDAGTDTITFGANYTITLGAQGELAVTSAIIIQGNGQANTIIEADPGPHTSAYRVFDVTAAGNLTLDGLTVRHGNCTGSCTGYPSYGGGMLNLGTASVRDSTFILNRAAFGGGVWNGGGTLTVLRSTFRENIATSNGGGVLSGGNLNVNRSTFSANAAYDAGGGILALGTVTLANSTLSHNGASNTGGGIYKHGGTLTIRNSTLTANGAPTGGGIYNTLNTLNYSNTIIGNSVTVDCVLDQASIGANSRNLVEDGSCSAALSGDPNLGPLDYNGGTTRTHMLLAGSPAIDAGNDTLCAAAPVNNIDQRGVVRPQGIRCDIGGVEVPQTTAALLSIGAQDGWILESSETSGLGGTKNGGGQVLNVGDDASRKQYRAILSFNTGGLPDNAVILFATLRFRKQGQVGSNPFAALGKLRADIKIGPFAASPALQLADFKAGSSMNSVLSLGNNPSGTGWYAGALGAPDLQYINTTGVTQFRLRFSKDDNNNAGADYLKFYSGNATSSDRPRLIITYYVP